jgi:hypothetical protein
MKQTEESLKIKRNIQAAKDRREKRLRQQAEAKVALQSIINCRPMNPLRFIGY